MIVFESFFVIAKIISNCLSIYVFQIEVEIELIL